MLRDFGKMLHNLRGKICFRLSNVLTLRKIRCFVSTHYASLAQMVKKRVKLSTLGSRVTSIVSVSLVLYIIGLLAALALVTHHITDALLGEVSIVVKVDPLVPEEKVADFGKLLEAAPYSASVSYASAQEVLLQEMEYHAEELALLDDNPYSPEYEIKLAPQYVNGDSIMALSESLSANSIVMEVVSQVDMVRSLNNAAQRIALGLAVVAAVLLFISLVLIFNAVNLSIYGRRFVIRTMQLVGATGAFIRKPFVAAAIMAGVVSAIVAFVGLVLTEAYVSTLNLEINLSIDWKELALVGGGLLIIGVAICGISAFIATNRYLSQSEDNLYN